MQCARDGFGCRKVILTLDIFILKTERKTPPKHDKEFLYCVGDHSLEQVTQRGYGVSLTGDTRELAGHNPVPSCGRGPVPCFVTIPAATKLHLHPTKKKAAALIMEEYEMGLYHHNETHSNELQ